ncbi:hypothetical protein B0H19DRAFT_1266203 [Mycena capillaripes]|nr:hypothetical protein B0H19DRAFT_1266203 [Mycena capillaripes]
MPDAEPSTTKSNVQPKTKKKPGNKGDFHGQREEFLHGRVEEYLSLSKMGKTHTFWPMLLSEYWEKFDWHLPLDQDPSPNDNFPSDEVLTTEETDAKSKNSSQSNWRKIKTWYNHQQTALGLLRNPFTPWLARLRQPEEKQPKRITPYQFYMQHPDYKEAVNAEFQEKHWDTPRSDHLARRCAVARTLYEAEPEDVKAQIRQEAAEEHEDKLTRWRDADEGLPSMDPEDQEECSGGNTEAGPSGSHANGEEDAVGEGSAMEGVVDEAVETEDESRGMDMQIDEVEEGEVTTPRWSYDDNEDLPFAGPP